MDRARWLERFWSQVDKRPDGCWIWTAGVSSDGYGQVGRKEFGTTLAHRIAYTLLVGPIPEGLELDHLCRDRACMNPAHLEAVDSRTNILRGSGMGARNARKSHCPQGHPYSGDNLHIRAKDGARICRACIKERRHQRVATRRASSLSFQTDQ